VQFGTAQSLTMLTGLQQLARREWWLWFWSIVVTALAGVVLLLSVFGSLFASRDHFYELTAAQARWSAFDLLLLFNAWMIYRLGMFRRARKGMSQPESSTEEDVSTAGASPQDSFRIDPTTSLCTRASFEYLLGKEVARSRRRNASLSLVAISLDDFTTFRQRFGANAAEAVAKEFVIRLRRASRGVDFGVRLAADSFLLALPECSLNDAKRVLDRLGDLEMQISGEDVTLTHSVGWIDYKSGEVPSDLIRRAEQVLQIYGKASKADSAPSLIARRR
jgi:diguanylate cyclase (GGDEF)-like protein